MFYLPTLAPVVITSSVFQVDLIMMFRSVLFFGCFLFLATPNLTLAARGNPCTDDGQLKGWAKRYYDADYCSPVETNTSPTINITSPNDQQSFSTEDAITFTATATDAEDGDLSSSVVWNSSLDGSITASTLLSSGSHLITASVYDSGNLVATDSLRIDVSEPINNPPTVSISSPVSGSTADEGTALLLKATASDVEDGDLTSSISWHSSLDGNIGNLVTLSVGNHLITATVWDSDGVSSTDEIFLSITELQNTTHSVNISWSAPLERVDGTALTLEELAGYQIDWKNQTTGSSGSVNVSGAINTFYQIDDLQSGAYSFTLKSVDSAGLVSSASPELLVDL